MVLTGSKKSVGKKIESCNSKLENVLKNLKDEKVKKHVQQCLAKYQKLATDTSNISYKNVRVMDPEKKKLIGFCRPINVNDLAKKFLGGDADQVISRSLMTQKISEYIKKNNLLHGRDISPDATLTNLLQYDSKTDEPLTMTSIQKYFKRFIV